MIQAKKSNINCDNKNIYEDTFNLQYELSLLSDLLFVLLQILRNILQTD